MLKWSPVWHVLHAGHFRVVNIVWEGSIVTVDIITYTNKALWLKLN